MMTLVVSPCRQVASSRRSGLRGRLRWSRSAVSAKRNQCPQIIDAPNRGCPAGGPYLYYLEPRGGAPSACTPPPFWPPPGACRAPAPDHRRPGWQTVPAGPCHCACTVPPARGSGTADGRPHADDEVARAGSRAALQQAHHAHTTPAGEWRHAGWATHRVHHAAYSCVVGLRGGASRRVYFAVAPRHLRPDSSPACCSCSLTERHHECRRRDTEA